MNVSNIYFGVINLSFIQWQKKNLKNSEKSITNFQSEKVTSAKIACFCPNSSKPQICSTYSDIKTEKTNKSSHFQKLEPLNIWLFSFFFFLINDNLKSFCSTSCHLLQFSVFSQTPIKAPFYQQSEHQRG